MCTIILEQADRGVVTVYGRPHVKRARSAQGAKVKSRRVQKKTCVARSPYPTKQWLGGKRDGMCTLVFWK